MELSFIGMNRATFDARAVRICTPLLALGLLMVTPAALACGQASHEAADVSASSESAPAVACETGIRAAKQRAVTGATPVARHSPSSSSAPGRTPAGMVWIPGGEFWMGSDEPKFPDARPWHRVQLSGYWIDKTLVTNDQFARFVAATHYVTVAERKPRAEDFPHAAPESLVAGSVVFTPPDHPISINNGMQWWSYVPGANWRHPEGPSSTIRGLGTHPVVQIAYEDAEAYSRWAGKRLPTEAEFEYAERGGLERKPYAWGSELKPGGKSMANTFQGHFPEENTAEDGYRGTSPVGSYRANGYGLYDMSGNVWEWTSDWYRPDYYQTLASEGPVAVNPKGPADSFDPSEPSISKRVHRGGSFLCTDQYCSRYQAGGRGKGEPSTGTNHLGFRLVQDSSLRTVVQYDRTPQR